MTIQPPVEMVRTCFAKSFHCMIESKWDTIACITDALVLITYLFPIISQSKWLLIGNIIESNLIPLLVGKVGLLDVSMQYKYPLTSSYNGDEMEKVVKQSMMAFIPPINSVYIFKIVPWSWSNCLF